MSLRGFRAMECWVYGSGGIACGSWSGLWGSGRQAFRIHRFCPGLLVFLVFNSRTFRALCYGSWKPPGLDTVTIIIVRDPIQEYHQPETEDPPPYSAGFGCRV